MPAIVDFVRRFGHEPPGTGDVFPNSGSTPQLPTPLPDRIHVIFKGGAEAILDLTTEHGRLSFGMLRALRLLARPAHAATSDDGLVEQVLVPLVTRVRDVRRLGDGTFHVRLERSNCRHIARVTNDDERARVALLKEAAGKNVQIAVTSDPDEHVIIGVEDPKQPPVPSPPERKFTAKEAIDRASAINECKAQELFESIAREICVLPLPPPPECGTGIPFQYPDDACWAVANKVFELIEATGIRAGKIWLFDGDSDLQGLKVKTRNRSGCFQVWDWHVAAFVKTGKTGVPRLLVIDPIAFLEQGPIDRDTWRKTLNKNKKGLIDFTAGEVYSQAFPQDPNYIITEDGETEGDLAVNRWALHKRSKGGTSPPPYSKCSTSI